MKKILVGYIKDGKSSGIDKYLLNFLNSVSSQGFQIDFLTNHIDIELKKKLSAFGSALFEIPTLRHPVQQYHITRKILENGKYDIAYFNISTTLNGLGAIAAKRSHVKKVVIHSHSSGNDCENRWKRKFLDFLNSVGKLLLYRTATDYLACSTKAGLWLYPKKIVNSKKFSLIFNAVDTNLFRYNEEIRLIYREQMDLANKFVVGHIGNFCYQKNHKFLLEIFSGLVQMRPNSVLLLVGNGPEFEMIEKKIKMMHLEKNVRLLGVRDDVSHLLQAMDAFVLPSNFEGLPIVAVEAQASGLKCFLSDVITSEIGITDLVHFISLKKPAEYWDDKINQESYNYDRSCYAEKVDLCGYDTHNSTEKFCFLE